MRELIHHKALSLWPNLTLITFQKPHLQVASQWGLEFQHTNFGGTETFS